MAKTQTNTDKGKSDIQFFDNGTQNVRLQDPVFYELILKKAQTQFPNDTNAQRNYFIKEVAFNTPAAIQYKRSNPKATADDFMQHVQEVKSKNNGMYVWQDQTRKNPRKSGTRYDKIDPNNYNLKNVAPEIAKEINSSYRYINSQSDMKDMFMLFGDVDVKNNIVSTLDEEYGGNHKGLNIFGKFTNQYFGEQPKPVGNIEEEPIVVTANREKIDFIKPNVQLPGNAKYTPFQNENTEVPIPELQKYAFPDPVNIPESNVNTDSAPEPDMPNIVPSNYNVAKQPYEELMRPSYNVDERIKKPALDLLPNTANYNYNSNDFYRNILEVPVPPIRDYTFPDALDVPDKNINTDFLPDPGFPSMKPPKPPKRSIPEKTSKDPKQQLPNPYMSLFPQEYVPGATWNLSQGLRPLDAVPLYTVSNPGNAMANNAISLASRTNRIDYQEEPIQQMNTSIMRQIDQSGMRGSARTAALLNSTNQNRMARGMNRTQVDTQNAAFAQQSNQQAAALYGTIGAQNQQMNMNAQLQNNQYKANQYDIQQKQMAVRQDYLNTFFTNDIPVIGTEYYNRSVDYAKAATMNKIADKGFFDALGNFQTDAQRQAKENDPTQLYVNQLYSNNNGFFNFGNRKAQVKKR